MESHTPYRKLTSLSALCLIFFFFYLVDGGRRDGHVGPFTWLYLVNLESCLDSIKKVESFGGV